MYSTCSHKRFQRIRIEALNFAFHIVFKNAEWTVCLAAADSSRDEAIAVSFIQ